MHDGSFGTLDEVVDHYAAGGMIARRPTLSADLDPDLVLSAEERAQLVAFLATLSSEDPPRPASSRRASNRPVSRAVPRRDDARRTEEQALRPRSRVAPGRRGPHDRQTTITRTHNVMVTDPRIPFTSEAQEPGDSVVVPFPEAGTTWWCAASTPRCGCR